MPRSGRASVPDVYSGEVTFSSSARPAIILAMNSNSRSAALQNEVKPILVANTLYWGPRIAQPNRHCRTRVEARAVAANAQRDGRADRELSF